MDSYNSMTKKLAPLRIYNLNGENEISTELRVIAREIDLLFDTLEIMTRECFIATAESYGISERESFFGKEKTELTAERRRALLMLLSYVNGTDITLTGFEAFVRSCGVQNFTYNETPTHARLVLTVRDELDDGSKKLLKERVEAYVPAQINVTTLFSS